MSKKALVIGLDGVPCSLLRRLMDAGVMPRCRDLAAAGRLGDMTVSLPPISSVSWTSFITGENPGAHGVFGFTDVTPNLGLRFPSFLDVKTPTLMDQLGERGLRATIINLPATYPARPVPGALISGFVAPDLARAVHPKSLLEDLRALNYAVDIDLASVKSDPDRLFPELHALLEVRANAARMLFDRQDWDLFMLVITGTDRLYHHAFQAGQDPAHPRHADFLAYHAAVDALAGEMTARFRAIGLGDEQLIMLLSDHGFCPIEQEVHVNRLLVEAGFLHFLTPDPTMITQLEPTRTRAFALDPARIYLNRMDRFPRGTVAASEIPDLLASLERLFLDLRHQDRPVFKAAIRREQAYQGAQSHLAPDLILLPHDGFDPKAALADVPFRRGGFSGMHTWDDAFWLMQGDAVSPDPATITDCTAILRRFFDIA